MSEEKEPRLAIDLDHGILSGPIKAIHRIGETVDDALPSTETTMYVAGAIGLGTVLAIVLGSISRR